MKILFLLLSLNIYSQCPISNFHEPILEEFTLGHTPHEAYPGFGFGALHAALDIITTHKADVYSVAPGKISIIYPYGKDNTSEYMETL